MDAKDFLGWASSLILLVTLIVQIRKQWREHTATGVSKWLFVGQVAAESGFVVYSLLLHNWVFLATNAALLIVNLAGLFINWRLKTHSGGERPSPALCQQS